jgi:phenylacetaldehyde dehydrogenase
VAVEIARNPIELSPEVRDFLGRPKRMLVGGEWLDARSGETFGTENPATGEQIAEVPAADKADVDAAVAAAREAFEGVWRSMAPAGRAALLYGVAELIDAHREELAQLEALDNGKPVTGARSLDVPFAAEMFRYMAGWATKLSGRTFDISLSGEPYHAYTRREPAGVAAGIVPWNYPLAQASFKIAPALAAGCTMILKPAEQTPLSALRLGELMVEAGIPAGVVNVVTGFGETAGAAVAAHPGIDKVTFTGSTAVGKSVLQASALSNLKRVTLELGGKSPNIIFADADLELSIPTAAAAIFANTGQVCNAGSRLYVQRPVFDEVMEGVAREASELRLGYGLDPSTDLGPLVSEAQRARVSGYVRAGLAEGAEAIVGNGDVEAEGYFFGPTILTNTRPEMSVVREEIFGPVLVAEPFDDLEEIAPVANETIYGLSASIFTSNLSTAHLLASRLKAGAVWINCFGLFDPNLPFGGFKQSGIGREMGLEGVEAFTEVKAVTVKL